jgi:hypothetical protein
MARDILRPRAEALMASPRTDNRLAGLFSRVSAAVLVVGFLMIPAAVVLRFMGTTAALAALGAELAAASLLAGWQFGASRMSVGQFLTKRVDVIDTGHPLTVMLAGLPFTLPVIYVVVTASQLGGGDFGAQTDLATVWLALVFLLLGAGVSGLGLSEWLASGAGERQHRRGPGGRRADHAPPADEP